MIKKLYELTSPLISTLKTQSRVALLIIIFAVMAGRTASALVINLTFDPDATFTGAGLTAQDVIDMKAACNFAAQQLTTKYTDAINVNIRVTAVPGVGTLGMSNTPIFSIDYAGLRNGVVADSKTPDDATTLASGTLPLVDPIGGGALYVVTRAQRKALGLAPDDMTTDGTYTFGGGHAYTYDPNNRAVAGRFDFIGVTLHEFTEIMGRIGNMGDNIFGQPDYMFFDLFHYTGAAVRGLNKGPGRSFSFDNGVTLLKGFNDAVANPGSDLQDWAAGTNDAFNAFSDPGVLNDLSEIDLRNMDVIGYDRMVVPPPPTTKTLTVASSPTNGVTITVTPNDNNAMGNGTTQFTRVYNNNTAVTLTAPGIFGLSLFQTWRQDGANVAGNPVTVTMDADHTLTAVYTPLPPPPPPCTPGSGNIVDGTGTLNGPGGGQASFNFHVQRGRRIPFISGNVMFSDPAAGISFGSRIIHRLSLNGNEAHFIGQARIKGRMRTYAVDVNDCPDTFSIEVGTGGSVYRASGVVTTGDILIHP